MSNIPKIIHILFNNIRPNTETELISKIRKNNENYIINIYYKNNINEYLLEYINTPIYLKNTNFNIYSHNVIILKYKILWLKYNILYVNGGVWIDSMCYLKRNIDSFIDLNSNHSIYGYQSLYNTNIIDSNYFLISSKNNILIKLYLEELKIFFNSYCLNSTDILNNGLKNYYKNNINYFNSSLISSNYLIKKCFPYTHEQFIWIKIINNNLKLKDEIKIIEPLISKNHPLFWCSQFGNVFELNFTSSYLNQSKELQNIFYSRSLLWLLNKKDNNIEKSPIIFLYNSTFIDKFEIFIKSNYNHNNNIKNKNKNIYTHKKIIQKKNSSKKIQYKSKFKDKDKTGNNTGDKAKAKSKL